MESQPQRCGYRKSYPRMERRESGASVVNCWCLRCNRLIPDKLCSRFVSFYLVLWNCAGNSFIFNELRRHYQQWMEQAPHNLFCNRWLRYNKIGDRNRIKQRQICEWLPYSVSSHSLIFASDYEWKERNAIRAITIVLTECYINLRKCDGTARAGCVCLYRGSRECGEGPPIVFWIRFETKNTSNSDYCYVRTALIGY